MFLLTGSMIAVPPPKALPGMLVRALAGEARAIHEQQQCSVRNTSPVHCRLAPVPPTLSHMRSRMLDMDFTEHWRLRPHPCTTPKMRQMMLS